MNTKGDFTIEQIGILILVVVIVIILIIASGYLDAIGRGVLDLL